MKTYITKKGQNIFDVCLMLYGSIEGVIDLIVNNESLQVTEYGPQSLAGQPLSFDTVFDRGIVLNYSEDLIINSTVVEYFKNNSITVANGETRSEPPIGYDRGDVKIVIQQRGGYVDFDLQPSSGILYVDWGDFSSVSQVGTERETLEHAYSDEGEHMISIYGSFQALEYMDFSRIDGVVYPTSVIPINGEGYLNNYNDTLCVLFAGLRQEESGLFQLDKTPLDSDFRLIS